MNSNLKHISPFVRYVRLNTSQPGIRSFIDPEYVFTYIKSGSGIYVVEGVEYQVEAGDMILMAPYMLYSTKCSRGEKMVQCVLHFDLFYDESRDGIVLLDSEMDFRKFSACESNPETLLVGAPLLRTAIPEAVQGKVYRHYESLAASFRETEREFKLWHDRAVMLEILALYLEQSPNQRQTSERSGNWRNIEKALAYIHSHYSEQVSLKDVSRKAGISMNYLCALFKQHTGQTMHRYLNELRIYQAKRLIEDSDLNMSEIAAATGLGDLHAFSKLFKKYENITPSNFRNQCRSRGRATLMKTL